MTTNPLDMLKKLSPIGRPGPAAPAGKAAPNAGSASGLDFSAMLAKARAGDGGSGLPIEIDPRSGVMLSDEQKARLAAAADKAAAEGIQNALVLIDGTALMMDVHTRTVTKKVDLSAGVQAGIDGVVSVPGAAGAGEAKAALTPPAPQTANASVASLLATLSAGKNENRRTA